jgi:uncharacterized protein (DUF1778 family)
MKSKLPVTSKIIRLSKADQQRIAHALRHPGPPTKALKKAARRYRELFGER